MMKLATVPARTGAILPAPGQRRATPGPLASLGNQALLRRLQAKLAIGAVDDPLEREADAVAGQVMRMAEPSPSTSSFPQISRKACSECEENDGPKLQAKRGDAGPVADAAPDSVGDVLNSPGRPLDGTTRGFFEPRFGRDFSGVRIHDDSRAAASARQIGARAYAVGEHIVFGSGSYAPGNHHGRQLLAHELAHTVQQGATRALRRDPAVPAPGDPAPAPAQTGDTAACLIHFVKASTEFTDAREFAACMASIKAYLAADPARTLELRGYASEEGSDEFNKDLSQRRADTAKRLLVSGGVAAGRLIAKGYGADKTYATLEDNRRVELPAATPKDQPAPVPPPKQETPAPTPPPVPSGPAPASDDCDAAQSSLIAGAVASAKSSIAAVTPLLTASPISADMQNALWLYFRDSSAATAATVSTNLAKISAKLSTVTYECESDCPENELGYTRLGAMVTGIGHIHLCMNNLKPSADEIADTIIHELAHYALLASDSAGYYGNDCGESDTTVGAGTSSKLGLADSYNCFVKNWRTASASDRANAKGDLTGANIAGITQAPPGPIDLSAGRKKPIFIMRLTRGPGAIIVGVSYRWILKGSDDQSYRMTDTSGNELFDFKPSLESVIGAINTPTRELLKQRGITSGTVICRATSPVFGDKLFQLPVTFQ